MDSQETIANEKISLVVTQEREEKKKGDHSANAAIVAHP